MLKSPTPDISNYFLSITIIILLWIGNEQFEDQHRSLELSEENRLCFLARESSLFYSLQTLTSWLSRESDIQNPLKLLSKGIFCNNPAFRLSHSLDKCPEGGHSCIAFLTWGLFCSEDTLLRISCSILLEMFEIEYLENLAKFPNSS